MLSHARKFGWVASLIFGLLVAINVDSSAIAQSVIADRKVQGMRPSNPTAYDIIVFKGIPYAAPPVGSLRWREPQPAESWSGGRKADGYGSTCIQPRGVSLANGGNPGTLSGLPLSQRIHTITGSLAEGSGLGVQTSGSPAWLKDDGSYDSTMLFSKTIALQSNFMKARLNIFIGTIKILGSISNCN